MLERAPIQDPEEDKIDEPKQGFFADLVETPFAAAGQIVDGASREAVEIIDGEPLNLDPDAKKVEQQPG